MPKNPTEAERIKWHLEHAKNCGCRGIPKNLQNKIITSQKTNQHV